MAVQPTTARTVAELASRSAERYGARPAVRVKRDGEWLERSYAEFGAIVEELALGLLDVGIEPGERVCILANTRPEWSFTSFAISAAGGVVVPIYPTNSPEECEWVVGNSGARGVVVEDAVQLAKIEQVRDRLPELEHTIGMNAGVAALDLEGLRARGRTAATAQSCGAVRRPSRTTMLTRSSTPRGPLGRQRVSCSHTATRCRSGRWSRSSDS